MVVVQLEEALGRVKVTFNEAASAFQPLARSLLNEPSLILSGLLLGVLAYGDEVVDRGGAENNSADGVFGYVPISACLALEFLDRGLCLAWSVTTDSNYDEDGLLVTDYLYGQAIDQVIEVGEPGVIAILARAISDSAEAKISRRFTDYRSSLIVAAFDIALLIGEYGSVTRKAIEAARRAAAEQASDFVGLLPAGAIRDFLRRSTSVVIAN